ncbi:hypothetical protein [Flavobacterium sp. H122]|uniref:hypothetical protein n=1 Tax=Flavobacterium sp. H122 TaxID=2529860 RepID=UPI00145A115D|nr:hypothetical protein [Flavobacterium sp. H122]
MLKFSKNQGNFFGVKSFRYIFAVKIIIGKMTKGSLVFDKDHSNVLIKIRKSMNRYLKTDILHSNGFLNVVDGQIEDLELEFVLGIVSDNYNFLRLNEQSKVSFKSISFQKINTTLNFIKGYLTINNVVKVVELEVSLLYTKEQDSVSTAFVEVNGVLDKNAFGWDLNGYKNLRDFPLSPKINLVANLDFKNLNVG